MNVYCEYCIPIDVVDCIFSGVDACISVTSLSEHSELKPVLSDYPDYDHLINHVSVQLEGKEE